MTEATGQSRIGVTGLAVMGANLARNIASRGVPIAVHNRTTAKTRDFIAGVPAEAVAAAAGRTVSMKIGGQALSFTAETYLLQFVLPNFFFHVTTAYDILRQQGVPLGKRDYLGDVVTQPA